MKEDEPFVIKAATSKRFTVFKLEGMVWEIIPSEKALSKESAFCLSKINHQQSVSEHIDPPIGLENTVVNVRRTMSTLVSVITPTRLKENRMEWFIELNKSIREQDAEHVVVVDREDKPVLPSEIEATVLYPQKVVGQAVSRNLAIKSSHGSYITSADDDDIIPPNSIKSRLQGILDAPEAKWSCGYLSDLRGAELSLWEHKAKPGFYSPGEIAQLWEYPLDEFPLPPTGMLVEKNSLLSAGGWGGLGQGEDFFMVLAVTNRFSGVVVEDVVYHYRKHTEQMMNTPDFDLLEEASREFCYNVSKAYNS